MKKVLIATFLAGLMALPAQAGAGGTFDEVEGCQVLNPAQSTCSYEATHEGGTMVMGIFGWGSWTVKIKVGKKTTVEKSPSTGEPTVVEMTIPEGAKVKMTANSPGSGGTVGHVD
ncbi:MAG TPA: hypothetical protein VJ927_07405 [Actinomycetota bacterium]|nr:hypothetical protein [Actinomycetota bacterium]